VRSAIRRFALALVAGILTAPLAAQGPFLLDSAQARLIAQEVSGDAAYVHIRYMSQFHRPRAGADNLWRVAEYFAEKAREYGLTNVQVIKQASTTRPWNARFADLWLTGPEPMRIASTLQSPLHLADNSRAADVTAAIVDVGAGDSSDYVGKDVAGKLVFTYAALGTAMRLAVRERGAAGVIVYPNPFTTPQGTSGGGFSHPDQIRWVTVQGEGTFAFNLSLRQGAELRAKIAASPTPLMARAVVEAGFTSRQGEEPWQVMVEAVIPGTDTTLNQDIVLTGHLQEEDHSANDDASGCASVLEIGRALTRLIAEGRLPRPRRTIRLWWATEISSERQYFADHPDVVRRLWVNVNQDMVGANQAQDVMRVQNVTRLPATRFHFLNDVTEAVVERLVAANNSEIAQVQSGFGLYPDPTLAHTGTMHRYNAKMVFSHNNTDHMVFNEAPIGIPATTFTNMPDRYIHSSDDDLWNIDATQLGRNAVAVATIAYIMATADGGRAQTLAAETVGRGAERLSRNLRLGLSWIAAAADKGAAFNDARDQVQYAAERERRAINSLREVHPAAAALLPPLLAELDRRAAQAQRDLEVAYRQAAGGTRTPPARRASETEARLMALRPTLVGGPKEFLTGRGQVQSVTGLHGLMAFEVMNAVDGRRSGLDIYRLVAAEAREAGTWYYGTVTAAAVLQYLENIAKAGLIRLTP
jgi:peptidase M28-like protein